MPYTKTILFKLGEPGLTIKVALRRSAGTIDPVIREVAAPAAFTGSGNYLFHSVVMPSAVHGILVAYTGTLPSDATDFTAVTVKDETGINPPQFFIESGTVPINHDTGGVDNLRLLDGLSNGIDEANVRAYLLSDYSAGRITTEYIKGQTKTGIVNNGTNTRSGRMPVPMYLQGGGIDYVIVYHKANVIQAMPKQLHLA